MHRRSTPPTSALGVRRRIGIEQGLKIGRRRGGLVVDRAKAGGAAA